MRVDFALRKFRSVTENDRSMADYDKSPYSHSKIISELYEASIINDAQSAKPTHSALGEMQNKRR